MEQGSFEVTVEARTGEANYTSKDGNVIIKMDQGGNLTVHDKLNNIHGTAGPDMVLDSGYESVFDSVNGALERYQETP